MEGVVNGNPDSGNDMEVNAGMDGSPAPTDMPAPDASQGAPGTGDEDDGAFAPEGGDEGSEAPAEHEPAPQAPTPPEGRARKESYSYLDRVIIESFNRMMTAKVAPVRAATYIAEKHGVDLEEVVSIIKEAKATKDKMIFKTSKSKSTDGKGKSVQVGKTKPFVKNVDYKEVSKKKVEETKDGAIASKAFGLGSTTFGLLDIGDTFKFKGDESLNTKTSKTSYKNSSGNTFKTGAGSAVFKSKKVEEKDTSAEPSKKKWCINVIDGGKKSHFIVTADDARTARQKFRLKHPNACINGDIVEWNEKNVTMMEKSIREHGFLNTPPPNAQTSAPSTAVPRTAFTTFDERWKAFPVDQDFIAKESPDHIWGCFGVTTGFCYGTGEQGEMKRLSKKLLDMKMNPDAPVNIRKESFERDFTRIVKEAKEKKGANGSKNSLTRAEALIKDNGFYVEKMDGVWHVFGDQSGFSYGKFTDRTKARELFDQLDAKKKEDRIVKKK